MNPYVNEHARLLDRLFQQADALAAEANKWNGALATAKAEVIAAEETFVADFRAEAARDLAALHNRVRDLTGIVTAIENAGGPSEARRRALLTPACFSTFKLGFEEKIQTLTKMAPVALKRLGARCAELTEAGLDFRLVERDPLVGTLHAYHAAIVTSLATAVFGRDYSAARGGSYEPRSPDKLLEDLTLPLPEAPATPSA